MTSSPTAQGSPMHDASWFAEGSDPSAVVLASSAPPAGVVEAFVSGKHPTAPCEDVIAFSAHHVAVIDGMSSPLRRTGQRRTGREYAERAAKVIAQLPAEIEARDAVDRITVALHSLRPRHAGPAGAVCAVCSLARREVWRIGDVHIAIGQTRLPGTKAVDAAMTAFRAAVNAARLAGGMSLADVVEKDPGLAATRLLLRAQPALANRDVPYGYGVLNGSDVPDAFIEVYELGDAAQVVLATDGYLGPERSLAQAESLLRAAVGQDPAAIGVLRDMGKAVRPGASAPDDRSYVRLFVGAQRTRPTARGRWPAGAVGRDGQGKSDVDSCRDLERSVAGARSEAEYPR